MWVLNGIVAILIQSHCLPLSPTEWLILCQSEIQDDHHLGAEAVLPDRRCHYIRRSTVQRNSEPGEYLLDLSLQGVLPLEFVTHLTSLVLIVQQIDEPFLAQFCG